MMVKVTGTQIKFEHAWQSLHKHNVHLQDASSTINITVKNKNVDYRRCGMLITLYLHLHLHLKVEYRLSSVHGTLKLNLPIC